MPGQFKTLVKEQIKQKLIAFEGDAKSSKIRSVMKWWSKCISTAIAKTASRNVAFKVAKMRESIMEDQDEFLICKSEHEEVGLETNNKAVLEDVHRAKCRFVVVVGCSCRSILPIKRATRKIRRLTSAEL